MIYIDQYPEWIVPSGHMFHKGGHLFGTDIEELHTFAKKIGLKREWYQNQVFPHYDLTSGKRKIAIHHGATPVEAGVIPDGVIRHDPNP